MSRDDGGRSGRFELFPCQQPNRNAGEDAFLGRQRRRAARSRPTKPADPDVSRSFRVFPPGMRHRERRIHQAHAELEGQLVLGIGRQDGADRWRGAAMQPGDRHAALVETGFEPLDEDGVIVAMVQVVLARPGTWTGSPSIAWLIRPASSTKSGLDLRPKPPPRSVTCISDRPSCAACAQAAARWRSARRCRPRHRFCLEGALDVRLQGQDRHNARTGRPHGLT
jgi:hypothetical protein